MRFTGSVALKNAKTEKTSTVLSLQAIFVVLSDLLNAKKALLKFYNDKVCI